MSGVAAALALYAALGSSNVYALGLAIASAVPLPLRREIAYLRTLLAAGAVAIAGSPELVAVIAVLAPIASLFEERFPLSLLSLAGVAGLAWRPLALLSSLPSIVSALGVQPWERSAVASLVEDPQRIVALRVLFRRVLADLLLVPSARAILGFEKRVGPSILETMSLRNLLPLALLAGSLPAVQSGSLLPLAPIAGLSAAIAWGGLARNLLSYAAPPLAAAAPILATASPLLGYAPALILSLLAIAEGCDTAALEARCRERLARGLPLPTRFGLCTTLDVAIAAIRSSGAGRPETRATIAVEVLREASAVALFTLAGASPALALLLPATRSRASAVPLAAALAVAALTAVS